jgi:hypothetical protein
MMKDEKAPHTLRHAGEAAEALMMDHEERVAEALREQTEELRLLRKELERMTGSVVLLGNILKNRL